MTQPKEDAQRTPGQPSRDETTCPADMEDERSNFDDMTTRPSERKDNSPIDHPTTSRQPLYRNTDAPGTASGNPTE